jgi:hypothetical protein
MRELLASSIEAAIVLELRVLNATDPAAGAPGAGTSGIQPLDGYRDSDTGKASDLYGV